MSVTDSYSDTEDTLDSSSSSDSIKERDLLARLKDWTLKKCEANDQLNQTLYKKKKYYGIKFEPLLEGSKSKILEDIQDTQALALSYMHQCTDEIHDELVKISIAQNTFRRYWQNLFFQYKNRAAIKLTNTNIEDLINADLTELQREIDIRKAYIEYLNEMKRQFNEVNWMIKNKIEFAKYFG
jgi:hypothetical protein